MNISEEKFDNLFTIEPNKLVDEAPFGGMYETFGNEFDYVVDMHNVHPDRVWTILDVEGKFYITTGLHYVNRYGYLITKEPFKQEFTVEVDTGDLSTL